MFPREIPGRSLASFIWQQTQWVWETLKKLVTIHDHLTNQHPTLFSCLVGLYVALFVHMICASIQWQKIRLSYNQGRVPQSKQQIDSTSIQPVSIFQHQLHKTQCLPWSKYILSTSVRMQISGLNNYSETWELWRVIYPIAFHSIPILNPIKSIV